MTPHRKFCSFNIITKFKTVSRYFCLLYNILVSPRINVQPRIIGLINHIQQLGTYDIQEIILKGVIYASYCGSRTGHIDREQFCL